MAVDFQLQATFFNTMHFDTEKMEKFCKNHNNDHD